jgi:pantetheine-phosphate adenylyltransferase
MKVCIGGTFNILHIGHKQLINKAIEIAGPKGSLFIGLTSMEFVQNKENLKTYEERKNNLENYISEKKFLDRLTIKPISDKYGPTIDDDFDAIVVSPETIKTAEEINGKRNEKGKKPLKIVKINFVLAKDGLPISSSRINNKEIDENGKILNKD